MSSESQPNTQDADELETAVDQRIAACAGDLRATIRTLIVANNYLDSENERLKKAVSHAFLRGRFETYSG
jgi:regulator of replication initiation timing